MNQYVMDTQAHQNVSIHNKLTVNLLQVLHQPKKNNKYQQVYLASHENQFVALKYTIFLIATIPLVRESHEVCSSTLVMLPHKTSFHLRK